MTDRPTQAQDAVDDEVLLASLWRRGRRAALIGAAIGLGSDVVFTVAIVLVVGLLDASGGSTHLTTAETLSLLPYAVMPVAFGAMIGLTVAGWSLGQRMTFTAGPRPEAKRIRDLVMKGAPAADLGEEARALRWARIAAVYVPYQAVTFGLLFLGLLSNQIRTLAAPPDGALGVLAWSGAVLALALSVAAIALTLFMLRSGRRARDYAERASRRS